MVRLSSNLLTVVLVGGGGGGGREAEAQECEWVARRIWEEGEETEKQGKS